MPFHGIVARQVPEQIFLLRLGNFSIFSNTFKLIQNIAPAVINAIYSLAIAFKLHKNPN
jgi:hypothetical protein